MTDSKDLKEPVCSQIENAGVGSSETVQNSQPSRLHERRKLKKLQTLVEDANEEQNSSLNSASVESKHELGEASQINDVQTGVAQQIRNGETTKNEDPNKLPSIFESKQPQTDVQEIFQLKTRPARMDLSIDEESQPISENDKDENTSKIDQLGQEVDEWLNQLAPTSAVEIQPERRSPQTPLQDKEVESSTPTSSVSGALSGRPQSIAIDEF